MPKGLDLLNMVKRNIKMPKRKHSLFTIPKQYFKWIPPNCNHPANSINYMAMFSSRSQ